MKFYKYIADCDRFESLTPRRYLKDREIIYALMDGESVAKLWQPLAVNVDRTKKRSSDFPSLYGPIPVFSERAVGALAPLLGDFVEPLPLQCSSKTPYFAMNVLSVVDALDRKKSEIEYDSDGDVTFVRRYSLIKKRIGKLNIFKLPETKALEVFVSEAFRECVEEEGLTGLKFVPLIE